MSRKLLLLYIVLGLATFGAFFPPTITWILQLMHKPYVPYELLGSTEWITIVSLLVTSYFGANHMEKRLAINNGIPVENLDQTVQQIKNNPNNQNDDNNDDEKQKLKDALKHD